MGFEDRLIYDWDKLTKEVSSFSNAWQQAGKSPEHSAKALRAASKMLQFSLWVKQCTTQYSVYLGLARTTNALLKSGGEAEEHLQQVGDFVQQLLNSVAPKTFTYQGFKITNPQHLSEELCRRALEGVDLLKATFKKRGVEKLITEGLQSVNLVVTGGAPNSVAFYGSDRGADVPQITLYAGNGSTAFDSNGLSNFIHEFGHFVYYDFLPSEAKKVWDAPWDANPRSKWEKPWDAKELDAPTEYAKTNKFEDFSETFAVFMVQPERLSPTARYRMQQVFSVAGVYGKRVMPIASRVVARFASR